MPEWRFYIFNSSNRGIVDIPVILPKGEGIYVYFECENLDEQVEKIKEKGIEFDQEPTDQRWLWREARLKDVDGNQIVLFYGGENRLNPPWRVK